MKRKWFVMLLVLAIVLGTGAWASYWLLHRVLPYSSIKPYRLVVEEMPEFSRGHLPSQFGLVYESLEVQTSDSIMLKGYFIKAPSPKATIILLHGIGACKEQFYSFCQRLTAIGANCIIFDMRAHGQSGGEYCTFGAKEKTDIVRVIDAVAATDTLPIGIFGNSLGGAVALQALGIDKRIQFGIIESTFDEFPKVALEYADDFVGFKNEWLTYYVLGQSGKIAQFDPFAVLPVASCQQITQPIFMAHGAADANIPISFGKRNFEALPSQQKEFIEVKTAGHFDLQNKGGDAYWRQMEAFILGQYR